MFKTQFDAKFYTLIFGQKVHFPLNQENKSNYALVVVELDGTEPDRDYVKKNAKIVDHIGDNLSSILEEFEEMEKKKTSIMHEKNGISVDIEDRNIRFRINSKIWIEESSSLEIFIEKYFRR